MKILLAGGLIVLVIFIAILLGRAANREWALYRSGKSLPIITTDAEKLEPVVVNSWPAHKARWPEPVVGVGMTQPLIEHYQRLAKDRADSWGPASEIILIVASALVGAQVPAAIKAFSLYMNTNEVFDFTNVSEVWGDEYFAWLRSLVGALTAAWPLLLAIIAVALRQQAKDFRTMERVYAEAARVLREADQSRHGQEPPETLSHLLRKIGAIAYQRFRSG